MQMIHNGFDEVVWIDSDIVVNRNSFTLVSGLTRNILLVAEHTLAQERWTGMPFVHDYRAFKSEEFSPSP
jgi:hypothetical protein